MPTSLHHTSALLRRVRFFLLILVVCLGGRPVQALESQALDFAPLSLTPTLIKDIRPGAEGANIRQATPFNGKLFFFADDGTHGWEPWISDGTSGGTYMIADLNPDGHAVDFISNPYPAWPRVWNGMVYFLASETSDPPVNYLWRTNGAPGNATKVDPHFQYFRFMTPIADALILFDSGSSGTVLLRKTTGSGVSTIADFTDNAFGYGFATLDGWAYFLTWGSSSGPFIPQLWKTDGAQAVLVKAFPEHLGYLPGVLMAANGLVFLAPNVSPYGVELWQSDGTEAGTQLVKDLNPSGGTLIPRMAVLGETLFFWGDNDSEAIYRTQGKTSGIELIEQRFGGAFTWMATAGGHVYYDLKSGAAPGLRRMRGGGPGTPLVIETLSSSAGAYQAGDFVLEALGHVFFSATNDARGAEVWVSDGTPAGTGLAADLNPGPASASPEGLFDLNGRLVAIATDGNSGGELWLYTAVDNQLYLPVVRR